MPPQPLSASGSTPTPGTTRPEALLPCPLHRRFQSIGLTAALVPPGVERGPSKVRSKTLRKADRKQRPDPEAGGPAAPAGPRDPAQNGGAPRSRLLSQVPFRPLPLPRLPSSDLLTERDARSVLRAASGPRSWLPVDTLTFAIALLLSCSWLLTQTPM